MLNSSKAFLPFTLNIFGYQKLKTTKKFLTENFLGSSDLYIRGVNKKIDNLNQFLKTVKIKFGVLCISKGSCETLNVLNNSNYVTTGYDIIHQKRGKHKRGGLCIFFK